LSIRRVFGDGTGRLRTVWRVLVFLVAEGVVALAVGVALGVALAVMLPSVHAAQADEPVLSMLIGGPFLAVSSLGVVFLCRMLLDRRDVASIGLGRPPAGCAASPVGGVVLGLLAAGTPLLALVASGVLRIEGIAVSWVTLAAVPALVMSAFYEELIFRGYLLRNMMDVGRPVWGVLLTSLLFALAHVPNPHFLDSPLAGVNILLSGIALGLAYAATGNLWFATALHFGWNAAQALLFGAATSGYPMPGILRLSPAGGAPDLLTGGEFGLEGSAAATVAIVVLILVLLAILNGRRRLGDHTGQALTGAPASF
jgi:membrane protease YdiL (CAAX protease family)